MSDNLDSQGFINFPRQKLSDAQKTDKWYKKNIDFAGHLLTSDVNLRNSFKNKRINYNLRANVISPKDFERFINPDNLDLAALALYKGNKTFDILDDDQNNASWIIMSRAREFAFKNESNRCEFTGRLSVRGCFYTKNKRR